MSSSLPQVVLPKEDFGALLEFCGQLIQTGFLPKPVNTPAKAAAIVLAGRELGLGPMQSFRALHIVEGKVTLAADLQLALFKRAGGKAHFAVLTENLATLDLELPSGDKHRETFTIGDARLAGLAHKDNWKKYPKAMLRSRVITAGLRSIGFEATTGLYDPEELEPDKPINFEHLNDDPRKDVTQEIEKRLVNKLAERTGEDLEAFATEYPNQDTAPGPNGSPGASDEPTVEIGVDQMPTAEQYRRLKAEVARHLLPLERGDGDLKIAFPKRLLAEVFNIDAIGDNAQVTVWRRREPPDISAEALEKALAWLESHDPNPEKTDDLRPSSPPA